MLMYASLISPAAHAATPDHPPPLKHPAAHGSRSPDEPPATTGRTPHGAADTTTSRCQQLAPMQRTVQHDMRRIQQLDMLQSVNHPNPRFRQHAQSPIQTTIGTKRRGASQPICAICVIRGSDNPVPFAERSGRITRSETNAGDARGGAVGQHPLSLDGRGLG